MSVPYPTARVSPTTLMSMAKKVWWISSAIIAGLAVVGIATTGVVVTERYGDLERAPALEISAPTPRLIPAQAEGEVNNTALAATLAELADTDQLGTLSGQVTDVETGEVIWSQNADRALTPASATKVLTAAAAIYQLDRSTRLVTEVVDGGEGTVIIRAAGDVWLSPERLDELAADLADQGQINQVLIDTGIWEGADYLPSWDPTNVDAGYVAPMAPAMIHAGRIGAATGDIPRSHTPALDVASALAERVGAGTTGAGSAPGDARVLASTESPPLSQRVNEMMVNSDNVMAEAIGREIALSRNQTPDFAGATQATLAVLTEHGFDTSATDLSDNSGLSAENNITAALLDALLLDAARGSELAAVLRTLPVAGGTGTLIDRYGELAGRGWVRAKTGSLTDTSALAGVVTAENGRVYTFALLSNDAPILEQRRAMDQMTSAIRDS